jgi:predicted RNA binding protein YcfA (HicA-like mRNA interferase family)
MRIARDLSGQNLAKKLATFGYQVTRQTGSHMRLTTSTNGTCHVTIPAHKNLRVGTLSNVLNSIAGHFEVSPEELLSQLFGAQS